MFHSLQKILVPLLIKQTLHTHSQTFFPSSNTTMKYSGTEKADKVFPLIQKTYNELFHFACSEEQNTEPSKLSVQQKLFQ